MILPKTAFDSAGLGVTVSMGVWVSTLCTVLLWADACNKDEVPGHVLEASEDPTSRVLSAEHVMRRIESKEQVTH
jgi:hypothetical protein